ncbi:hypothetical protein CRG98_024155 [Punica granatum]|uniref:Uncharacterized protein n=1 Tax=Punica granatum TaxID=22663 RepID=A0A2I0JGR9_PUNGR|nr:hypothetical protein CRG98_024155 [Punica granatum]
MQNRLSSTQTGLNLIKSPLRQANRGSPTDARISSDEDKGSLSDMCTSSEEDHLAGYSGSDDNADMAANPVLHELIKRIEIGCILFMIMSRGVISQRIIFLATASLRISSLRL